jgi:hypothetical protein
VKTITILPSGEIEFLGDTCPIDLPLANPVRRRVSTIQPTVWWKRTAFLFLRRVCGERGRVAAFTRRWKGPWKAVILATGESAMFDSRQAAIDWEYEVLSSPRFDL